MSKDKDCQKEIKRSARMEFIARITLEDGTVVERKVPVDGGVPDRNEMDLSSIDGLKRSFDVYEQATLAASNKLRNEIAEEYMSELSKKKSKTE